MDEVLLSKNDNNEPVADHEQHPANGNFLKKIYTRSAIYEGGEHTLLGDAILLTFLSGKLKACKLTPYVDGPNSLYHNPDSYTFGEVLALGGDFIGDPDHPISDSSNRGGQFNENYNQLCYLATYDKGQIANILELIHTEISMLNEALKSGTDPREVYKKIGDSFSLQWNIITGGTNAGPIPVKLGRYLKLALTNWDHFGHKAELCYKAGHAEAFQMALKARQATTDILKDKMLQVAYAMDAYACHFLTDMFSSGHMRTPRKELYNYFNYTPASISGLLARAMHDQDSEIGLTVNNTIGRTWTAYGDGHLEIKDNHENMVIAVSAVQASVDELWTAFSTGNSEITFDALRYAPQYVESLNQKNKSPLFKCDPSSGKVYIRNSYALSDYSWSEPISSGTALAWIEAGNLLNSLLGND